MKAKNKGKSMRDVRRPGMEGAPPVDNSEAGRIKRLVKMKHGMEENWGHLSADERRRLADLLEKNVQQLRITADLLDGRALLAGAQN